MRATAEGEKRSVTSSLLVVRARRRGPIRAAALALLMFAALLVPAQAGQATTEVTVCQVRRSAPQHEVTVRVPQHTADALLRNSLSYPGPCAEYGERADLGNSGPTAYTQREGSVPKAIGVVFRRGSLDGLPYHPPSAGLWCYDKDGDGTTDPHTECAGGYEHALHLSPAFKRKVDTPFTYVLSNWNPHGHNPEGVWNVPHFDIHFYVNDNAERLAIRPGPCPVLVNCDDYKLGKILPPAKYVAPGYVDVDALEPAMGNHLIDPNSPEFNGAPFTHTFLYGVWNGHITFYEPMVTLAWYEGLRKRTIKDRCFPITLPSAWERKGWYPTAYCLRYRPNRDELTTSLENFVYRHAT